MGTWFARDKPLDRRRGFAYNTKKQSGGLSHDPKRHRTGHPAYRGHLCHIHDNEESGRSIVGWIRGVYPTADTARAALEADDLFVMEENGAVVAAARINKIQVPVYADVPWRYLDVPDEQVMVLHTLVVEPACSGKGYGTAFVKFYEDYARENGCPYLRMDTNARNQTARKMYAGLGYWEAGIMPCVFNGIPGVQLVCLEKKL